VKIAVQPFFYVGNLPLLSFSLSVTQILSGDIKETQITH